MFFQFEYPQYVLVMAGLFSLLWLWRRYGKRSVLFTVPLGAPGGNTFGLRYDWRIMLWCSRAGEWLGILLLIIAAGNPQLVENKPFYLERGQEIMFVLDVSPSMAALDMGGKNRLEAAKAVIQRLAGLRPADALGLVAVGRDAALLVPPTIDHGTFFKRLNNLKLGELGDGTAIGMGLALAAFHTQKMANLKEGSAPMVVLLTDGENNAGSIHPDRAAEIIKDLGLSFWVIGVGRQGEVPLDYTDPSTGERRVGTFESRYDVQSLMSLAEKGGGGFMVADSVESLEKAFTRVDRSSKKTSRVVHVAVRHSLLKPFLEWGVILLVVFWIIRRILLRELV
ncbi:MAG TPA: VWA domain-containing protein [Termitinemataceae bacterium]|uniref:VWA domain-containing protein n=1 Tax=Treponema sp. J25 TaxID=2094121 RepID=UPI0010435B96|nr:VWA domain-containing protein [Treponema sp. J25]TCW60471.1 aerotolerance regulator BatA [Treponema sp. J25]HOJ98468.1 VWA domain-containing protein [Termitinemataceae bacterium]HOM22834.1 VWA domain-containing protein [Termitinemataceae bacterium]HPP99775.1 VWA domain-containing protein [Termitinemataceae bacterium]